MLRRFLPLLCAPSNVTLTGRLSELAGRVESGTFHSAEVWSQIEETSHFARALKETDSLLAVAFRLLRDGHYPPSPSAWPLLVGHLSPFSDVETDAVLSYPGVPDVRDDAWDTPNTPQTSFTTHDSLPLRFSSSRSKAELTWRDNGELWAAGKDAFADASPLLHPSRETLLLTGGVVPLSARSPCGNGNTLAKILNAFLAAHTQQPMDILVLHEVAKATNTALRRLAKNLSLRGGSVQLVDAIVRFMGLFLPLDHSQTAPTSAQDQQRLDILMEFATGLSDGLQENAFGALLVAHFLAFHHSHFPDAMLHLPLARIAARRVRYFCHKLPPNSTSLADLQHVNDSLDVTLQRNANNGNLIGLTKAEEVDLRLLMTIAILRVMRLESLGAPDSFLRGAVDIVDRSPASVAIEYELLVGKVRLLDYFADDPDSATAIYDDLLQSLRALVELRHRDEVERTSSASASSSFTETAPNAASQSQSTSSTTDIGTDAKSATTRDSAQDEALLQWQFQEAHRLVVDAFARSHLNDRINEAYTILVAHKYHGLLITRELTHPLLDILSRRGDCRVFNIVDLCVLYSGSSIDYETLTFLFRACRVAGDHYRARTLYQLLREMTPGFILNAPSEAREALQELKVLDPEPRHMFTAAFDENMGDINDEVVLVDDETRILTGGKLWGPMRELPTSDKSSSSTGENTHRGQTASTTPSFTTISPTVTNKPFNRAKKKQQANE